MNEPLNEKLYRRLKRLEARVRLWQGVTVAIGTLALVGVGLALVQMRQTGKQSQIRFAYGAASATLSAAMLSIVDESGDRVELRSAGLRFFNSRGNQLAGITFEGEEKQPGLWLNDSPGRGVVGVSIRDNGLPELVLSNADDKFLIRLGISQDDVPTLMLRGTNGLQQVLTSSPSPTVPVAPSPAMGMQSPSMAPSAGTSR